MHGENSLSLAGEVSTTDPELLSHRVLIKGSDVEQKGSAMRRSGWLSFHQLIPWDLGVGAGLPTKSGPASTRAAAFNFTLTVTTGEGQQ
jgi:hypothetical protein